PRPESRSAAHEPVEAFWWRKPRTAKACGPGTRGWCQADGDLSGPTGLRRIVNPSATVARGIRRRGERAISRKTIAQGRPGVPAHLAVTRVHFCARSRVLRAPGFPCALFVFRGHRRSHHFGRLAPRECEGMSCRMIACESSLRAKRSNPSLRARGAMDCFVASVLAMTAEAAFRAVGQSNP